ncbi:protein dachsous-like, partial [Copidosoma floridanum]|uniref:protein dachsous-like n=1 Tax=Copidosoma floridanum TaxID=29053 RepID=UPI0006C976E7
DDQDSLKEIACITAFDHDLSDENNGLTYYLAHLTRGFTMNPISGRLFMNCTELLRPLPKEIVLEIVAKDSGKPSLNATCLIIIRLTEPGHNMLDKQHSLAIKENATVGTVLMALSDIDLVNAVITATDGIGVFEISEERIILVKSLDRETKERYFIQLDSKNENSTKAFFNEGPVTVVINISDVNDNHPYFTQDLYQVVINEDTLINTTIIRVQAKDSDYGYNLSSAVKYTITSGNDANFFKINQLSGSVWVNRNLDFDLGPELHHLTIMACDSDIINPLCTCTRLLIKLEDVNDNLPIFPVSEYFKYIGENEPVGTKVFTAHAFDYDRSIDRNLNYSILSTASYIFSSLVEDYKLFSINAITGVVTTKNVFDYEKKHHYVFTICATDNGGHTATAKINVDIESRDEFYPQFTQRLYRFDIKRDFNISASISIGNVKATDEDKGPDGYVLYHFLKHDPFFKLNRTTGELALKMKLGLVDTRSLNFYKLYVCANSGRKNSLSNITVVEIFIIKNVVKQNLNKTSTFPLPPSKDINLSDSTDDSLAYWISLFFTFFLLLVLTVISIFIYFNTLYQNNKDLHEKSILSSECSPAMISSHTNSSVFHSIAIKNNIGIKESDSNSSVHKVYENEATCQFLLPKYDEIPLYRTSIPRIQALSESSTSIQSGSSGHGSAEDDDEDDAEINSFDDEQQANEMTSDLLVNNTKEYLARLGIVDSPINILREPSKIIPLETLRLIEVETTAEAEFARLLCGKIRGSNRSFSDLDIESLSINRSFSSIVYREEDLIKLYDWNNFIYSELQYQSLAHVFHEIAALPTHTNNEVNESSNYYILQVTPSLTSVPTTTLNVPIIARTISPRLPITHDNATFQSVALCPSFSPSLSPLTTRTSSVSPLVPTTSRCHRTTRGISINATNI